MTSNEKKKKRRKQHTPGLLRLTLTLEVQVPPLFAKRFFLQTANATAAQKYRPVAAAEICMSHPYYLGPESTSRAAMTAGPRLIHIAHFVAFTNDKQNIK